jgi:hypothetical protein
MPTVMNEDELRKLTAAERRELARNLAKIDYHHPLLGINLTRGEKLGALISVICCLVLAGWIIVLGLTLSRSFHAHYWRGAWVGFDAILLLAFAATGWAFWRGRQIVIVCLLVTASLLCCDAWFDVILDLGTGDIWGSVASALLVELPIALLMFQGARRLIRLSAVVAVSGSAADGDPGDPGVLPLDTLPPLWKIPLFGIGPAERDPVSR